MADLVVVLAQLSTLAYISVAASYLVVRLSLTWVYPPATKALFATLLCMLACQGLASTWAAGLGLILFLASTVFYIAMADIWMSAKPDDEDDGEGGDEWSDPDPYTPRTGRRSGPSAWDKPMPTGSLT